MLHLTVINNLKHILEGHWSHLYLRTLAGYFNFPSISKPLLLYKLASTWFQLADRIDSNLDSSPSSALLSKMAIGQEMTLGTRLNLFQSGPTTQRFHVASKQWSFLSVVFAVAALFVCFVRFLTISVIMAQSPKVTSGRLLGCPSDARIHTYRNNNNYNILKHFIPI